MGRYLITNYDELNLQNKKLFTINVEDNNCPHIKENDIVIIDNNEYKVKSLEWFKKSFDLKGSNVAIEV